jgi:hypothetical protein
VVILLQENLGKLKSSNRRATSGNMVILLLGR